jgi:hypothetical protein
MQLSSQASHTQLRAAFLLSEGKGPVASKNCSECVTTFRQGCDGAFAFLKAKTDGWWAPHRPSNNHRKETYNDC